MTDTEILSYIGAIGGVLGTVTGIAGAVIAFVSYKKTEQLKVLDLRIELGKIVVGLIDDVDELQVLLELAKKSRLAVASASGMLKSGATEKWEKQFQADERSVASLYEGVEELNTNHAIATTKDLEEALIVAHMHQKTATRIKLKYEQSISADDKKRDELRSEILEKFSRA